MADYIFTVTSRPVQTKDNAEFVRVFQDLGFEESEVLYDGSAYVGSYGQAYWDDDSMIVVFDKRTDKVVGAFNSYSNVEGTLEEYLNQMGIEDDINNFEEVTAEAYVQSMLLDGQAFVLTEAGNEKLRYNNGWALIISKNEVKCFDISRLVDMFLEEKCLLGK